MLSTNVFRFRIRKDENRDSKVDLFFTHSLVMLKLKPSCLRKWTNKLSHLLKSINTISLNDKNGKSYSFVLSCRNITHFFTKRRKEMLDFGGWGGGERRLVSQQFSVSVNTLSLGNLNQHWGRKGQICASLKIGPTSMNSETGCKQAHLSGLLARSESFITVHYRGKPLNVWLTCI